MHVLHIFRATSDGVVLDFELEYSDTADLTSTELKQRLLGRSGHFPDAGLQIDEDSAAFTVQGLNQILIKTLYLKLLSFCQ